MPVDQLPPRSARRPAEDARLVQYDQYIDRQIESTRRAVKAVDWATAVVTLVIGVLAFLLTVALAEHWIVPGGFSVLARYMLFAVLVGGVGYFFYWRLWPLCRRTINPVYAAQTIEQASPTLKNSLINLLLFRQHRNEISPAVYQTLEEQAAQRLTRASVESAVDRTTLIRVGYVLLGVVALGSLYKIFSPKDPLVAAERVLLPWADVVPASRVSITDIAPGAVTVSRGEFIDVSAEIRGLDEDDAVLLRYTTDDGQAIDKPIEMKVAREGLRFEARLPETARGSSRVGLAQNARYRIEAGDARSLEYSIRVVPAPSILVERVEYDYPDYTGFVDRVVEEVGDIRAIEGTRVTIHARTNGPIRQAEVDFDADGRRDLNMESRGTDARASFVLALREDRQTPRHASYVLRYTNDEGRANREPVKYAIVVDADQLPEAAIVQPREKSRDVRLDETLTIAVEAIDPDFGLAEVRLHGEAAGRTVFDEPLLSAKHTGRFTGRYQFTPSAHDLRAGDIVQYWVVANDVRAPEANTGESLRQLLRVTSPDAEEQPPPPPDRIAQNDPRRQQRQQPQPEERRPQDGGDRQQGEQQPQNGNEQQPGDQQAPNNEPFSRDPQGSTEPDQSQGETERKSQGDERQSPPGGGENAEGNQQQNGEPQRRDGQQGGDAQQQQQQRGERNDEQTGAGTAGGETSNDGSQPAGTRPDNANGAQPANGQRRNGGEPPPESEPAPVSSEGDQDADAFERIRRHMERQGELSEGARKGQPGAEADPQQGDTEKGEQGAEQQEQPAGGEDAPARTDAEGADQPAERDAQGREGEPREGNSNQSPGAETKPDDVPDDATPSPNDDQQTKSPSGQQTNSKGPSGAGEEQENKGAPNAQPEMKPAEKRQQPGSETDQSEETEPAAGARGRRESDSQGEEGGDKAGGGEEGGGQKAPREGTGSAGQNQSADDGAGESAEKGAGNDSPNAGSDAVSDEPTGQHGEQTPGRGSSQRDGEGAKPGGSEQQPGDEESGKQGAGDSQDGEPTSVGGQQRDGQQQESANSNNNERDPGTSRQDPNPAGGTPTGEGGKNGTAGTPSPSQGEAPAADAANLEYTRKQTDLVLDKLADQLKQKQVDKNLLEKLGWSEEDLRRFVSRWQERKAAAARPDAAGDVARRELDDALRSLGLRPGTLRQSTATDDTQRDLRQGFRGPVPLEYQDRLRAYNQGVSRARQKGE